MDITPPVMTVSDISASVPENSTATISFSAIDAGSGVAALRATLNGAPIADGDTVTFGQVGANILRVEAIDHAGNPAVKEIDFTVAPPAPRSISFPASGDTYMDANAPDINHGSDAILRLRARGKNRALAKFDEAAIENAIGSSTIVSATLTFSVAKNWENWAEQESLELHRMTAPWTETGATWNAENSTSPSPWIAKPSATTTVSNDTTNSISFDVTADVEAFLRGAENYGWILQKADECMPGVIDFGSRESVASPSLDITYGF